MQLRGCRPSQLVLRLLLESRRDCPEDDLYAVEDSIGFLGGPLLEVDVTFGHNDVCEETVGLEALGFVSLYR